VLVYHSFSTIWSRLRLELLSAATLAESCTSGAIHCIGLELEPQFTSMNVYFTHDVNVNSCFDIVSTGVIMVLYNP